MPRAVKRLAEVDARFNTRPETGYKKRLGNGSCCPSHVCSKNLIGKQCAVHTNIFCSQIDLHCSPIHAQSHDEDTATGL